MGPQAAERDVPRMRIIVASLALCAVFALAMGETEIDESMFQAIEDDVAQTVQTLKGLQGDSAVTELDEETESAPKAKAGKKKAKKAMAKAKAAGAKNAKKKVAAAVHLKNTGIRRFKAIITRTRNRYDRRMDRAKARVLKAQTRSLKRLQRSSGGKAAIKAARQIRENASAQADAYAVKKISRKTKWANARARRHERSSSREARNLYRHLDRKAQYNKELKKETYLRKGHKAALLAQFQAAMAALQHKH